MGRTKAPAGGMSGRAGGRISMRLRPEVVLETFHLFWVEVENAWHVYCSYSGRRRQGYFASFLCHLIKYTVHLMPRTSRSRLIVLHILTATHPITISIWLEDGGEVPMSYLNITADM